MKLLLTSAGIKNASIHDALIDLLGKPTAESSALCIPTAAYGHPLAGPAAAWRFVSGQDTPCPMVELGWKSLGVLELTALPSLPEERWVPFVEETDVLLVTGGDALYLCHWMRQSGLADMLPSLGIVDFSICPHLAPDGMPGNSMAEAEEWAAKIPNRAYAVDDETAFKVTDGDVEIVSEGQWKLLNS